MMTNNNSMAVQAPASAASLSVYSNIIFDCALKETRLPPSSDLPAAANPHSSGL